MTDNYGAEYAVQKDTLKGTWSIDDKEFDLVVEGISKGTLNLIEEYMQAARQAERIEDDEAAENLAEGLEDFPWENGQDKDAIDSIIDAKLVKPEIRAEDIDFRKLLAIVEGMMQAWQEGEQYREAKQEMPIDQGNR